MQTRVNLVTAYRPWLILLVLLAAIAVEIHGFRTSNLFSQEIWLPVGQAHLMQFAGIFLAIATILLLLLPWLFTRFATAPLILLTAILLPKAILAVAFFLLSAWCLGSLSGKKDVAVSILLGIAIYLTLMPFAARLPINYPMVYFLILAIPIAIRRPRLRIPAFPSLPTWSERGAFALLVFVFIIHWFAMLKPEASADGLAVHLAVPIDIAQHHILTYEPARFIWAVMPMGSDFTYTIVYLLGGEHAARLLNLALLAILLGLLHTVVRQWVSPAIAWLLLALFAATPMVHLLTGELFAENLLAALLLASFIAIWRRWFLIAAVLAGAAIATKLGALPFVGLMLLCAAIERPRLRSAAIAFALLVATAAPPYAIAWAKTGNPVFPFLNAKFQSPLLPKDAEIQDTRFREPLTWRTPYDLTFRTNQYYEGQHGSFGFQYLIFAPLALAAMLVMRQRAPMGAALVALGAIVIVLRSDSNARYLYPELVLLTIPFAALLGWAAQNHRLLQRALAIAALAATALDIWFLPSSSYYHKDLYGPFTNAQRDQYLGGAAPSRLVNQWFSRTHPNAPVLLTEDSAIVGLTGDVYTNHWHQYNIADRIRRTPDPPALHRLLAGWRVQYLIAHKLDTHHLLRPQVLRDLLAHCTIPEFVYDELFVARLEPDCSAVPERPVRPEIIATLGLHDDFDPLILYRGDWDRRTDFAEPLSHTVSFSDLPGSEASFAFEGGQLTWIFTKAPNRGIAAVSIDGSPRGVFDLYAPKTVWRSQVTFNIGAGKHLLVIRVTGEHRPAATGAFVDIDALEVK